MASEPIQASHKTASWPVDKAKEAARKPTFVGRDRELVLIEDSLQAPRHGQSSVILVAGEAGVGKTRLMYEAASRAEAEGWLVLTGHGYDAGEAPPYAAFAEALGPHVRRMPATELPRVTVEHAAELARLLPELTAGVPRLSGAPPVTPMSERYRFFEAVSEFVAAIARAQPAGLLLSLDDLHLADEASLRLLEHLARRMANEPVVVIATYRDAEPAAAQPSDPVQDRPFGRTVEVLTRQRRALSIDLKPLDLDATRQLLAALAGSRPPAAVARAMHQESDGNPFYIEELFSSLATEGRLFDAEGRWRGQLRLGEAEVPRGVRLIVGRRLARLGAECREILTLAAVLGRRFDYELLREVSGAADQSLLEALDEAKRSQVVQDGAEGMQFSHELIRQTLLGELSLPRRQQLHLRAAQAIERQVQGGNDARLAELAGHYNLAGPFADPATVLRYTTEAGVRAAAAFAFEEALRLYDVALEKAQSLNDAGQYEETIVALRERRAEAQFSLGNWRRARPDLEAALDKVPSRRQGEVLVNLALACSWTPDMPAAKRYAREAEELVAKQGLHHLDATIAALHAHCDVDDGDLKKAIAGFKRSASLAGEQPSGAYRRLLWLFPAILYQTARHSDAIAVAEAAIAIARQARDVAELANMLPTLGLALGGAGLYREADRVLAEGRRVAADYQAPGLVAISKSAGFRLDTFDLAGAKPFAEEAHDPAGSVEHWPFPTVSSGLDLIYIAARSGEAGEAESRLKEVARQVEGAMGRHGWLWRMRLEQAKAEVALIKGEWRRAQEFATGAFEQSSAILRPKYQALALETRGKALIGLGRKRDGLADLGQAVELARPVGDPAMFLRAAAELLAFDGDHALAAEAYQAAERIAAELPEEMLPVFEDAELVRLVRRLHAEPRKRQHGPAGLSQRELEVLELIAAGRSNQQIAEALVLSVRTVERHINHIYAKAGVNSRTQAMAFAMREGIGEEVSRHD